MLVLGLKLVILEKAQDTFASVTDVIGGCFGIYESKLSQSSVATMTELKGKARAPDVNAIVGVNPEYEVVGQSMLMVAFSGTAALI